MSNKAKTNLNTLLKHWHLLMLVFVSLYITALILLAWFAVSLSISEIIDKNSQLATAKANFNPDQEQTVSKNEILSLPPSKPVLLRVPALNLVVEFENPLGLNEDKTVQAPESFEKVAWYKHTSTPGEVGPSVILGHVDSFRGPAVFYSLGELNKGDIIRITREDGTVAIFEIYQTEVVEQENFPNNKVYGSVPNSEVRLITCTGVYDRNIRRYSHNLIVYGELKEIHVPENFKREIGS